MFDPSSRTLSHLGAQFLAHAARRGGAAFGQRVDVHVRGGERVAERGRAVLRGTAGSQPAPPSVPRASNRGDIIVTRCRAVVASSTLPLAATSHIVVTSHAPRFVPAFEAPHERDGWVPMSP